jgi:hypothetical protein
VPPDVIPHLRPHLGETKIVYMSKITVHRAKPGYRPVVNPYMIKLNKRTEITKAVNPELDFPKYTFSLVPFSELQNYVKKTERFLGKAILLKNQIACNPLNILFKNFSQYLYFVYKCYWKNYRSFRCSNSLYLFRRLPKRIIHLQDLKYVPHNINLYYQSHYIVLMQ